MRLKNVLSRITGLSTPYGGVSWSASVSEAQRARKVIAFLEDRRVLFNPNSLEIPDHCVASILEIRHFLTESLDGLSDSSPLTANVRVMRGACRKFLDGTQGDDRGETVRHANMPGHYASWEFYSALGELRGVFGIALALISDAYDIDIQGELYLILPDLN